MDVPPTMALDASARWVGTREPGGGSARVPSTLWLPGWENAMLVLQLMCGESPYTCKKKKCGGLILNVTRNKAPLENVAWATNGQRLTI